MLQVEGLSKRYGGLVATDDLSLDVVPGELHAIIGPNGAGKTTLIAQLSGELAPTAGTIRFGADDITGQAMPERVRCGLVRSFQITSVFNEFPALTNVALAVQARAGHSFRGWRDARRDERLTGPALAALRLVGLGDRAAVPAALLSHGERRQLELAMALATEPKFLLLDEPMAGMGPEESQGMVALLAQLKGRYTILLVEHDMKAVFALADRISVLVRGRIVATGLPEAIRADRNVRDAYLGDGEIGHA